MISKRALKEYAEAQMYLYEQAMTAFSRGKEGLSPEIKALFDKQALEDDFDTLRGRATGWSFVAGWANGGKQDILSALMSPFPVDASKSAIAWREVIALVARAMIDSSFEDEEDE